MALVSTVRGSGRVADGARAANGAVARPPGHAGSPAGVGVLGRAQDSDGSADDESDRVEGPLVSTVRGSAWVFTLKA